MTESSIIRGLWLVANRRLLDKMIQSLHFMRNSVTLPERIGCNVLAAAGVMIHPNQVLTGEATSKEPLNYMAIVNRNQS